MKAHIRSFPEQTAGGPFAFSASGEFWPKTACCRCCFRLGTGGRPQMKDGYGIKDIHQNRDPRRRGQVCRRPDARERLSCGPLAQAAEAFARYLARQSAGRRMSKDKEAGHNRKSEEKRVCLDDLEIELIGVTTTRRQAFRNLVILVAAYSSSLGLLYWLLH
ncbi:hypothetical protein [Paracoccus sp. N5]|uniref:hypothetical protein n=1 Tax=Paracoccus sp. N5 TaxID=1101189 RepID=UPI0012F9E994|nr:hypothetical protein [Paracoccus sp. N5]